MVEWKRLGEVISVHTGSQLNRNDMLEQGICPVINGGRTPSGYTNEPNENGNSITISQGGESAGFVNWIDCDFWAGAHCYVVECLDDTSKRYVYHFLKNSEHELMTSKQGAGIPGLNRKNLYKLEIPVPSIAEQTRIIVILDTFTAAIDNLKQQIAQRRKQYEHYRDQLLDLDGKDGVEMKTLGEVCNKISAGKNKEKNKAGQYPVFGSTGIIAYSNSYMYDTSHILVARVGANAGFVHESYGKYDVTDNTLIVIVKDDICQKYVFHLLVRENINKYAKGGGQPLITASLLKNIAIPVPSLSEQQRIVSILDTFEQNIANLEQQLAQREKQYEYYRNKLLKFD